MGLEDRLSRADRAVFRDGLTGAFTGHGVDAAAGFHEAVRDQIARPVDQAVTHDVAGHLHLTLGGHFRRAHQRTQSAERQRVQQHGDFGGIVANPGDHLAALLLVGGVHVEEDRFAAGGANFLLDFGCVRQGLAAVEVDSIDVVAGCRQLDRYCFAEAAARAED